MTRTRIAKEIVLWILTLMLALVCIRSGLLKLTGNVFWVRDFHRWGYPDWFRIVVGVAEVASAVLLLIPRVAVCGAALFAVVMFGAIYTHANHNESARLPFNFFLVALSLIVMVARARGFTQWFRNLARKGGA
jgi:uncharacterized membrane protein YphA (DoxX/SURF4 family)